MCVCVCVYASIEVVLVSNSNMSDLNNEMSASRVVNSQINDEYVRAQMQVVAKIARFLKQSGESDIEIRDLRSRIVRIEAENAKTRTGYLERLLF
jgi:hypothetical protein